MTRSGAAADPASLGALARGGTANLVSAGLGSLTGIALTLTVTRGLPAAEAGAFFAATSVFVLSARVSVLGTDTGLVYFLSRSRAVGGRAGPQAWLRTALLPLTAFAVAAAVALLAAAPGLAGLLGFTDRPAVLGMLRVLAVFLPFAVLCDALLAATRGLGGMRPTALIDQLGRPGLQLLLVMAAIAVGIPPAGAWALPYLPAAVLAAIWLIALAGPRPPGSTRPRAGRVPSPAAAGPDGARHSAAFWRFTGPRALAGAAQVALQRLDIILVAAMLGPAEAAVYTAATRFVVLGQLVGQAFTMAVQPRLAAALSRGDLPRARSLYQTATSWLVLVAWPLYLTMVFLAPVILRLFGASYDAGAAVTVLLSLAMLVATGCGAVDTVLTMSGRTGWNLVNVSLALAVNVGVDLVAIPRLGIEGAAVGWAAAVLTNNLLPLAQVGASLRLHPLGSGTARAMGLAALCFGALPLAVRLLTGEVGWVGAALLGGLAVYLVGCWRSRAVLQLAALATALPRRPPSRSGPARRVEPAAPSPSPTAAAR